MQQSDQGIVTINVFTVPPDKQLQLIELLGRATRESITHAAGFLGASLYRSIDGTKVTMHAQWRSLADYEAMRRSGGSEQTLAAALALATFAPGMYEVVESFGAEK
jgi:heme-degrading monooxygenase HmoA